MSQRTVRSKAKKRAQKLSTKSWEALDAGDPLMALKLARRATVEHPSNATFWDDLGLIAQQNDSLEEAERAFQNAILLDPTRAESYANFAALCALKGRLHQAARLQERAAQLAPQLQSFQEKATLYLALTPPDK
jgi:Flp pilus assembly protein TadD